MESEPVKSQVHVRVVRLSGWKVLLAAGAAALLIAAILFLTLTVLLIVVPIALVAGALYYLFGGRRPAGRAEVIEGEYRVVQPREIERGRDERP
ncbi:MAG TPA: hypothetical protein VN930_10105 [Xanthobacteraceae bacterium]|jgi:uncharacterized membrane protein|nr:hypothetical protein [Xanthobacteraceae bacterium]